MKTSDPRISTLHHLGQVVFLPDDQAWRDLLRDRTLDDAQVLIPDWVEAWLKNCNQISVSRLGLILSAAGWQPVAFLLVGDSIVRVHFENVICDRCGQRCGPSAAPEVDAYAGTGLTTSEVWAEFDALQIQSCPTCGRDLERRQTVWLADATE